MGRVWYHYAIALGLLVAAAPLPGRLGGNEPVPLHHPLAALSYDLDGWRGQDQPITDRVLERLGTSDVLLRSYEDAAGNRVGLYVSYFARQQQGEQSHSPKNCLPGAGWQPLVDRRVPYPFDDAAGEMNEIVFGKDQSRELVYYWFRERNRVVASEYMVRWYLVVDAITRQRTNGALIRVSAPVRESEAETRATLDAFMQVAIPALDNILPD